MKAENTAKPADPDDIYATLDWDTNPPINGFYEMMMGLTPERRKELRELARQHNEKQVAEKTEVKAVPETSREQPRQEETQPEAVAAPAVTDTPSEAVGTFLFPDIEAEKPKEEVVDLSPRAYHRTPEMHLREGSLVADRGRHNIGYLKDITPYGATFQPLDLKGYQKEKALLYVSLRDAYERLYRYESLRREANVPWREHLNTCYDEFVMRYGNLNAKQNVKLVMMDVCVAQQIWYGQSRLYAGDNRQHGGGFAHCPARAHLLQSARDRLRNQRPFHRRKCHRESGTHRGMDG